MRKFLIPIISEEETPANKGAENKAGGEETEFIGLASMNLDEEQKGKDLKHKWFILSNNNLNYFQFFPENGCSKIAFLSFRKKENLRIDNLRILRYTFWTCFKEIGFRSITVDGLNWWNNYWSAHLSVTFFRWLGIRPNVCDWYTLGKWIN